MGSGYAPHVSSPKAFDQGVGEAGVQLQWVLKVRRDLNESWAWKSPQVQHTSHLKGAGGWMQLRACDPDGGELNERGESGTLATSTS